MPSVSVIIPCFNEENTIALLLEALYNQTFPLSKIEVIIADGFSTDMTRERIASFARDHPELIIQVVDNPLRNIPAALNQAIRTARNEVIIRLDAHSVPYPNYIAACIAALENGMGDNVGGVWDIQPFSLPNQAPSWISQAIAAAAGHPFGVGDALYRFSRQAQQVDTVPFGAFRKSLVEQIGFFDETLLTNEDYEFNTRIRKQGGKVWLDPAIRTIYFARPNLNALAKQYWRYGYWKVRMLTRYAESLRWRQALPPLFVSGMIGLCILGIWYNPALWLVLGLFGTYFALLFVASLKIAAEKKNLSLAIGIPVAIATMHFSWGTGFLWSFSSMLFNRSNSR
jgi:glycosyltransferase involved in cell wall biosynthesis